MINQKIWKGIALVAITIVIIESAFIIWAWNVGTSLYENENLCTEICEDLGADSYGFEEHKNKLCQCYKNNELISSRFIN